jgi:hypothetical protein
MTHYLRFPDEATAITVLAAYRTEDDTWITASHSHALDVIGEIPECAGWHANFIGDLPESWADYVVTPEQPVRVFLF